jgi:hypothetical protein
MSDWMLPPEGSRDPHLPELNADRLRAGARNLDDYRLAEHLAVAAARRDVAAGFGYPGIAESWNAAVCAFAEVRDERARTRHAFDRLSEQMQGMTVMPMTPEETDTAWPD